ncbi:hypothetical protein Tco_1039143 [Tanacetum coccineum]
MDITVVTLVGEQMSSWKGNLSRLPIRSNGTWRPRELGGLVQDIMDGDKDQLLDEYGSSIWMVVELERA